MTGHLAEIASLRQRVASSDATVAYLKNLLAGPLPWPAAWRLSAAEGRIVAALYRHRAGLTKAGLHAASGDGFEPDSDPRVVKAFVWKIRRKLSAHVAGPFVETLPGPVYRLTAAARAACAAAIQQGESDVSF